MARTCPDCLIDLTSRNFEGTDLDTCTQCAGIFFDGGEIAAVKNTLGFEALDDSVRQAALSEPRPQADSPTRLCPACHVAMVSYRYMYSSPVRLDECEDCGGVWVQDGELKQMAEYARTEQGMDTNAAALAQVEVQTIGDMMRARQAEAGMKQMARRYFRRFL